MEGFYFSVNLDNDRTLCLAPLTNRRAAMAEQEITDLSGYFLFETKASDGLEATEIIARVLSEDAALRLRDMLQMT